MLQSAGYLARALSLATLRKRNSAGEDLPDLPERVFLLETFWSLTRQRMATHSALAGYNQIKARAYYVIIWPKVFHFKVGLQWRRAANVIQEGYRNNNKTVAVDGAENLRSELHLK